MADYDTDATERGMQHEIEELKIRNAELDRQFRFSQDLRTELETKNTHLQQMLANELVNKAEKVGLQRQLDDVRAKNTDLEIANRSLREALKQDFEPSDFAIELERARKKFPPMASAHEGYAVILEELDELWEIVKQKQTERDYTAMRKETVQLGAMVLAFLVEICDTENRR